jgi:hypothetical protein
MLTYLKWIYWKIYYLFRPCPKELLPLLIQGERTRPPWWRFKPYMWHNDEGNQWEIYFTEERDYTQVQDIRVTAHIGLDTGKIIGLTIWDENLKEKSNG